LRATETDSALASAYVALDDGRFAATELTRGPWHPEHQHAGPPIALVARAIERAATERGLQHVGRLTANLLRPIPIAPLALEVQTDYAGRNVARPVAESSVQRFPWSMQLTGYHDLIESRVAEGVMFRGPSAVWMRMRYPLVVGEEPSALQRIAVAADSANGTSAVLDMDRYVFVNSDLTVNLLRPAQGEWICVDARTLLGARGSGLAEARIFDSAGLVGRSTQSLAIRRRD